MRTLWAWEPSLGTLELGSGRAAKTQGLEKQLGSQPPHCLRAVVSEAQRIRGPWPQGRTVELQRPWNRPVQPLCVTDGEPEAKRGRDVNQLGGGEDGSRAGLTHCFLSLSPFSLFFLLFPSPQFTSALKPLRSLPCPEKGLSPPPPAAPPPLSHIFQPHLPGSVCVCRVCAPL